MAAINPAVDRIRYLAGESKNYRGTPNTITAKYNDIYSYGKCIAMQDGDSGWYVTNDRSSVTTNRHIKAAHIALGSGRTNCGEVPGPAHPMSSGTNWTYYLTHTLQSAKTVTDRVKYLIDQIDNERPYDGSFTDGYQATTRVMFGGQDGREVTRVPVIIRGSYVVAWKDHTWWMVSPAIYSVIQAFKIDHTFMGDSTKSNGTKWIMYSDLNRYGKKGDSVMVGTVSDHDFVCDKCDHWFVPSKDDIKITDMIQTMICPNCGTRLMIVDRKTVDLGMPFSSDEIAAMSQTVGHVIKLSGSFTDREDV